MLPTFQHGDRVLAARFCPWGWMQRWLQKGHIVVLHFQPELGKPDMRFRGAKGTLYIKRLIGLPGDLVVIHPFELPTSYSKSRDAQVDTNGRLIWSIPPQYGFVKGDSLGFDSTVVGPVPLRNIRGVVVMKLRARRRFQKTSPKSDWQSDLQQE
jgi:signal peptidase I